MFQRNHKIPLPLEGIQDFNLEIVPWIVHMGSGCLETNYLMCPRAVQPQCTQGQVAIINVDIITDRAAVNSLFLNDRIHMGWPYSRG